jgi:predicted aldo/keto reductase-like oxidoreductase
MIYRKLGRTGRDVSIVGLGAEHLEKADRKTVVDVVDCFLGGGGNYIDLFMASPDVRSHFGASHT